MNKKANFKDDILMLNSITNRDKFQEGDAISLYRRGLEKRANYVDFGKTV